jgi:hypothetical protein
VISAGMNRIIAEFGTSIHRIMEGCWRDQGIEQCLSLIRLREEDVILILTNVRESEGEVLNLEELSENGRTHRSTI